jgi:hypothetical protein
LANLGLLAGAVVVFFNGDRADAVLAANNMLNGGKIFSRQPAMRNNYNTYHSASSPYSPRFDPVVQSRNPSQ